MQLVAQSLVPLVSDGNEKAFSLEELQNSGVLTDEQLTFLKTKQVRRVRVNPSADHVWVYLSYSDHQGGLRVNRWGAPTNIDWEAQSESLESDILQIWQLVPTSSGMRPTFKSLAAAIRVFNTVQTKGKTPEEVMAVFQVPHKDRVFIGPRSGSKYGAMIIYIDTGYRGVALVFELDKNRKVFKSDKEFIR